MVPVFFVRPVKDIHQKVTFGNKHVISVQTLNLYVKIIMEKDTKMGKLFDVAISFATENEELADTVYHFIILWMSQRDLITEYR